ncbi:MAG: hypothetical protein Q8P90_03840 [bacterium]|nr:hypothetical protein [bacterium]
MTKPHLRLIQEGEVFPTTGVYELLKLAITQEIVEDPELLRDVLNDVYKELSPSDYELIEALTFLEDSGAITREDRMFFFVLFAVAKNIGPFNLNDIRDAIVFGTLQPESMQEKIIDIDINDTIKDYLIAGLAKLSIKRIPKES